MLGAVNQQNIVGVRGKTQARKIAGDHLAIRFAPGVRLVAQMRFNIADVGELSQGVTQLLALPRLRWVVKVQVTHARHHHLLVNAMTRREGNFAHKGAAPDFTTHQPHRLQFGINTRGGGKRNTFLRRQPPVRGQPGSGCELSIAYPCGESVDDRFVSRLHTMYP